jgi:hypothetical protein
MFGRYTADNIIAVFSECISLEKCLLFSIAPIDSQLVRPSTSRLRMPALTSAYLAFSCLSILPFMRALAISSLRTLKLLCEPGNGWSAHDYTPFFQPMRSTLEDFELQSQRSGPSTLIEGALFTYIPNIHYLRLPRHMLAPSTMEMIASGEFLPRVEQVEFSVDALPPALDMLIKRQSNAKSQSRPLTLIKTAKIRSPQGEVMINVHPQGVDV